MIYEEDNKAPKIVENASQTITRLVHRKKKVYVC